jgi:asparagine synthase (glutamine-hydrolysing)
MCGIVAIISPSKAKEHLDRVKDLTRSLEHRGDRGPKTRTFDGFALGCARLAIVDRPSGIQPFSDEGQRCSVVFNGEIYNHSDLRAELASAGFRFRTRCDTEVLLNGYLRWGSDLPRHLEGMYAFVIADRQGGTFLAARDPFGIKPLYYVTIDDNWYFSSEIYPLAQTVGGDLKALQPGSIVYQNQLRERVLYQDLTPLQPTQMPLPEAIELTRAALKASVRRHLPSDDLNTAIFCSGGIDSSAILFEAVNACRDLGLNPSHKLAVYCVGSTDSEDQRYASELAWSLGVPYRFEEIQVSEMVQSIPAAIETMETFEPNHIRAGTTSIAIARRVKDDNIKVVLVGEGADELFGGYEEFSLALKMEGITKVEELLRLFTSQLHRTQLRRVDRTTMAFGIEARVPFLDKRFTDLVLTIPTEYKVRRVAPDVVISKYVLREAYRGLLPDHIVNRRKVPMGEGAGVGDNRSCGPFHDFCDHAMTIDRFNAIREEFPEFQIRNKEEAYYFDLFHRRYGRLTLASLRPYTNLASTT